MIIKPEDYIGALGAILFLIFFWRTSIKKSKGRLWNELDVFLAAILLSYYAYRKGAYITIALNLVWIFVAFRGLTSYVERRIVRQKKRRR